MSHRRAALLIAALVFLADALTKLLVRSHVSVAETITVIPGCFNIVHTRNPGAAFSLLAAPEPGWRTQLLLVLSLAAVAVVAGLLWRTPDSEKLLHGGLALILGGALGNLYDRVRYGEVTDFLELYVGRFRWPAFNLADTAITAGALLVVLQLWRSHECGRN